MRRPAVEDATGLSTSAIYEMIAAREFPKPIPLGPRAVAWLEDEVRAWQETRIAMRDEKGGSASDRSAHRGKPCPASPDPAEQGWRMR